MHGVFVCAPAFMYDALTTEQLRMLAFSGSHLLDESPALPTNLPLFHFVDPGNPK